MIKTWCEFLCVLEGSESMLTVEHGVNNTFGIDRVIFRLCMSYICLDGLSRWCWENYCDFSKS